MSNKQPFRALLRHHRARAGQTQQQLADLSAMSVRAVRNLELGRTTRPRRDTVQLLADGLRLTGRARTEFEAAAGQRPTHAELEAMFGSTVLPPPAPLDSIVGRHAEVAFLRDLLTAGERFVTISGLPGMGKTRLALEVAGALHTASGFPVLWALAAHVPAAVHPRMPQQDRLTSEFRTAVGGLLTTPGNGPAEDLIHLIDERPCVLVLDGYEASRLGAASLVPLLEACPNLRLLVTSTMPLGLPGERTLSLAPLAVPEPVDQHRLDLVARSPSVQLLLRHARQAVPTFTLTRSKAPVVAELCDRLDGIPKALEAAASWFLVYDPTTLLHHVRTDPHPYAVSPDEDGGPSPLHVALARSVAALPPMEAHLLEVVAGVDPAWTISEAASMAGLEDGACARAVRRLTVGGLVRSVGDDRRRFRVLGLVRSHQSPASTTNRLRFTARHIAPPHLPESA